MSVQAESIGTLGPLGPPGRAYARRVGSGLIRDGSSVSLTDVSSLTFLPATGVHYAARARAAA